MIVAVSLPIVSLVVGHFRLCIDGLADKSKLLHVTILAARFCILDGSAVLSPHSSPIRNSNIENEALRFP